MLPNIASAQPAARRQQQQQAAQQQAGQLSVRAQISFPTQIPMSEDVVWRRDIYREIDITQDANAGLYYPVEPVGSQMNLFTYIFKLVMRRAVPAYEYRLDGNEVFDKSAQINLKSLLDNYHIFYERTDKGIHIDDSDIPSNDFGDAATSYPLFWIKYDDLAPFLTKQNIMTSNVNNAAVMSMDDFFTKNLYKGKIYKTNNMLGKTLAQYCPDEAAMTKEQKRIESELQAFEKNMWGDQARKDSLDSIARLDKKELKLQKKKKNRRAGSSASTTSTVKKTRRSSSSSKSSSGSARVTVRRERH